MAEVKIPEGFIPIEVSKPPSSKLSHVLVFTEKGNILPATYQSLLGNDIWESKTEDDESNILAWKFDE